MRRIATVVGLHMVAGAAGALAPASAAVVFANSSQVTGYQAGSAIAGAKHRFSHTNWDQSFGNSAETSNTANFMSANLGNSAALSGAAQSFSLAFVAGQGFTFTVGSSALTWRQDALTSGTSKPTLNGIGPLDRAFDSLKIDYRVLDEGNNRATLKLLSLTGLAFTHSGTTVGALTDATVSATPSSNGNQSGSQLIVSNADMRGFDWMLSGVVTLTQVGGGVDNGGEKIRLSITLSDATFVAPDIAPETDAVPAPGAAGLAFTALVARSGRRRCE